MCSLPALSDIREAREVLAKYFHPTPLVKAPSLSRPNTDAYLKIETTLPTGSFKPRGELYALIKNLERRRIDEVTASSLIKIDLDGNVMLNGTEYGVNKAGFIIHAAVHTARKDVFCVAHTHTAAGMAVSALQCGLLPIAQTSMRFYHVAYHDFDGMAEESAKGSS